MSNIVGVAVPPPNAVPYYKPNGELCGYVSAPDSISGRVGVQLLGPEWKDLGFVGGDE